jgi:hypothetical protein
MTNIEIIGIFFLALTSLLVVPCIMADIHAKFIKKKD